MNRRVLGYVCVIVLAAAGTSSGASLDWAAGLVINTDTGAISVDGQDLVALGFCTVSNLSPSVTGYGGATQYTISPGYLAGFDGLTISTSPSLTGSRAFALVVPGDITINAAWNLSGGNGANGGLQQGLPGGAGGAGGGFAGGASYPQAGFDGAGPGGGTGGNPTGAGGSLVASGGAGSNSSTKVASGFPAHPALAEDLWGGSGGGGSGYTQSVASYRGSGAGGGGAVGFFSSAVDGDITVTSLGSITVNGGAGGNGSRGGGGGAGGTIILRGGASGAVTLSGLLSAAGGAGRGTNTLGGGGSGGEVAVYYGTALTVEATPGVTGGAGYAAGSAGHYYTEQLAPPQPPTFHPGDANGDGAVDLQDFGLLKDHFGAGTGALWAQGDFNGDAAIDLQDFGILKDHFGHTAGSTPLAAVPEPATLLVLSLAACLRSRARSSGGFATTRSHRR